MTKCHHCSSARTFDVTITFAPQPYRVWDPLAAPYVSHECRAGAHDRCPGGLIYYPEGTIGDRVDVLCACGQTGCGCAAAAGEGIR